MSAATNLLYALAKLGRPPPACVGRLAAVLQAEAEAAEEAAEEAALQLEGQAAGWEPLDSAEYEEAAAEAREAREQRSAGVSGSDSDRRQPGGSGGADSQVLPGISLAACDPRGLCLLLWSLAELEACPPALLRHSMAALCRRRGLGRLSMQSMAHVLLAAQRLAAAAGQQGQEEEGGQQPWGAPVLSGAQRAQQRWQQRFRWDQAFMDAVTSELARRAKRAQQGQQGQRPPRPFNLNEQDCSVLARSFAAAWQEAAAASGAATGGSPHSTVMWYALCCHRVAAASCLLVSLLSLYPCPNVFLCTTDNRLKLASAVRRHVEASPLRRAALRLLQQRSGELAPRLRVQALSGAPASLLWLHRYPLCLPILQPAFHMPVLTQLLCI